MPASDARSTAAHRIAYHHQVVIIAIKASPSSVGGEHFTRFAVADVGFRDSNGENSCFFLLTREAKPVDATRQLPMTRFGCACRGSPSSSLFDDS